VLAPVGTGPVVLVGTVTGTLLALDTTSGRIEPLAGAEQGLRGEIVALAAKPDGRRIAALNADGEAFEIRDGRVRMLRSDPELVAPVLERLRASPQRSARVLDRWTHEEQWFALDGWAVWRVTPPE
jgi:hypothetical protein